MLVTGDGPELGAVFSRALTRNRRQPRALKDRVSIAQAEFDLAAVKIHIIKQELLIEQLELDGIDTSSQRLVLVGPIVDLNVLAQPGVGGRYSG